MRFDGPEGFAAGSEFERFEAAPVQEMRTDRADAHQDALVTEQWEEQREIWSVLLAGERHPDGPARIVVNEPELVGDHAEVVIEWETAKLRLRVDVLGHAIQKKHDLTIPQPFERERRYDGRLGPEGRDLW